MMSHIDYDEIKRSLLQQKKHVLEMMNEHQEEPNIVSQLQHQLENLEYIIELTDMNHYSRGNK